MRFTTIRLSGFIALGLALAGASAWAQIRVVPPSALSPAVVKPAPATNAAPAASPLPPGTQITADSMDYQEAQKLMQGDGHCIVRQGDVTLTADHMQINTDTQWAEADGNVVYTKGTAVWRGAKLRYNLKTKQGDFGMFTAVIPPWNISAKESKRLSTNEIVLKDVTITTCDPEHPEYSISAREAHLVNGHELKATGVLLHYLGIPFFYLPHMNRDLRAHNFWMEYLPGYSSRQGGFLLAAANYKMGQQFLGRTHLDYRTKRGLAGGQDFVWNGTNKMWDGELDTYYADDQQPFKDAQEEAAYSNLVSSERYRIKLLDFHSLSDRDYVISDINYLSDPNIIHDFFSDEYRAATIPENRITLTHRGDQYTAGLTLNKRLNDFYDNIDRLPELTYDLQRIKIGDSPFYFESQDAASELKHVHASGAGDTTPDYSAFRADSKNTVFYPSQQFDFLTLIPRAGYRGTYYSNTRQTTSEDQTSIVTGTNGVSTVLTNSILTVNKGGADVRNVGELGIETSFKSHRTWNDVIVLGSDDGFRHIVEPYANYTYIPKPNLEPADLPQFDSVDQVDKQNDVQFGIRNKFQTRRRGEVHDLMDFNIYTTYRLEKQTNQEDFADIGFDNQLRIWDTFPIDFDGTYDPYNSNLDTFNTQVSYMFGDLSTASVEYRYKYQDNDQLSYELVLFPTAKWSVQMYQRYDLVNNRLEEHEYFLQHKTDCMGYGIGFRQTDNDYQIWVRLFLLAFPESNIKLGQ